jgi:MFS family permease
MLRFLLGWSAWELTGSSTWVGVVAALMLAPAFLLSPYFGVLSDRINPRYGLIASMVIHAGISLGGAIADASGYYSLPTLLVLALAMGCVTSLHSPMRLALLPLLVGREAMPNAVGLSAMTFNTARVIGPAVGAWLISRFGLPVAWLVAVLMFSGSLLLLLTLRGLGQRAPQARQPIMAQFLSGVRYLRGHWGIRLVFGFTVINGLLGRTTIELLPAISGSLLQGGSSGLATLTAAAGVGSIVGGLVVSRQSASPARLLMLVAGGIAAGSALLVFVALITGLWSMTVLVALVSMVTTMGGTGCQTLTQLSVLEDYRGRVMSLWIVLAMGAPALGAAVVGVLADTLGFGVVLPAAGSVGLLLVGVLYSRRRRLLAPD